MTSNKNWNVSKLQKEQIKTQKQKVLWNVFFISCFPVKCWLNQYFKSKHCEKRRSFITVFLSQTPLQLTLPCVWEYSLKEVSVCNDFITCSYMCACRPLRARSCCDCWPMFHSDVQVSPSQNELVTRDVYHWRTHMTSLFKRWYVRLRADWLMFPVFQELEAELTEHWPSLLKIKSSFHFWYEILSESNTCRAPLLFKNY